MLYRNFCNVTVAINTAKVAILLGESLRIMGVVSRIIGDGGENLRIEKWAKNSDKNYISEPTTS